VISEKETSAQSWRDASESEAELACTFADVACGMFNYYNLLVPYLGLTILQIWHAILQIWHVRTGLICHAVSTASLVSSLSPFVPPLQGTFIPPP
jgi:hypothetical protein